MTMVRLCLLTLSIGLTIMVLLAIQEGSVVESLGYVTADPWGWVMLADLYFGFILFAVIIATIERNRWVALFWIVPLFFLGNIWSALWLVVRLAKIVQILR